MPVSDIFLSKVNPQNIFVLSDLNPDLYPFQGITWVFSKPSNHDPHTSRLWTQKRFVTPLSWDLKPDITKPTSKKFFIWYDLDHDLSASNNSGWVFSVVFREPLLLSSSWHDFENPTKDKKWAFNCGYIWRDI